MTLILLERSVRTRLAQASATSDWAQLSDTLNRLFPESEAIAPSDLAGLAALLNVWSEVAESYDAACPGYTNSLGEQAILDPQLGFALGDVALRWSCSTTMVPVVRALLLGAVCENPALASVSALLATSTWKPSGPFGFVVPRLRTLGEGIARPPGMQRALADELLRPVQASPSSLREQLRWILGNWASHLSEDSRSLVLLASDLLAEEQTYRGGGPGPVQLPGLGSAKHHGGDTFADETPHFSDDADWMPRLVLMAKQTYVWMDQLSRQYRRDIQHLDQIPDEELDHLAERGFTGLWLIGLWERSPASRTIKVHSGNPQAESSAYSLRGYEIAERLGGTTALDRLRDRAASRGIRLAADMVPNHMGMDSQWMVDHPDWFLQVPDPPFPSYTFDGPDVSGDDRISLYLEDGYWSQTDAAVVFKRVDRESGEVRYVYHGNDGTQMPWNDTAQLDYLKPQVREAVVQTIIAVARRFPVIRFDAAMTLARKHIARLWYPAPGEGGAIPSRAENSVPQEVFDELVGGEFWREVVERVQVEVPDTLLLAEAFWMMEGYFVRTLGMHRVYNSAFMHMLRDEDNAGYRGAIKSVLEYSPAILERYVNFMNNPDEETAVEQFGKGDKYFGIATVMATLPGLPMFGHGQLEGYTEKYGMEFTRAYRDEQPDEGLLAYHEQVIMPLLRDRHLFSGVARFALLDFWRDDAVDENVFAYANCSPDGSRPTLVLYNNAPESTTGWIKQSTAINVGSTDGPDLVRRSLGESLGIERNGLYGFWELRRRAWILRRGDALFDDGFYAELEAYGALVFLEIRALDDLDGAASRLHEQLRGGWCEELQTALADTRVLGVPTRDAEGTDPATDTNATETGPSPTANAEEEGETQ